MGLMVGLSVCLLFVCLAAFWYLNKMKKEAAQPPEEPAKQEPQDDVQQRMLDPVPAPAPAPPEKEDLRQLQPLQPGIYRMVGEQKIGAAAVETGECNGKVSPGDEVVIVEVIPSDNKLRGRLENGGYVTLADARQREDSTVYVGPPAPLRQTSFRSNGGVMEPEKATPYYFPPDQKALIHAGSFASGPPSTSPRRQQSLRVANRDRASRGSGDFSQGSRRSPSPPVRTSTAARLLSNRRSRNLDQEMEEKSDAPGLGRNSPRIQWESQRGLRPAPTSSKPRFYFPTTGDGSRHGQPEGDEPAD